MSRAGFVVGLLVLLGVLSAAENAHAARYVTMGDQGVVGIPTGTFYIGTQTLGDPSIQTLFSASFSGTDGSETPLFLRDQMMPAEGIPGIGKRANHPDFNETGFQVYHPDGVQFWASLDEENWVLVEPNEGVSLRVDGPSGQFVQILFRDTGSNGFSAVGVIPAVGGIGLLAMVAGLVAAGGVVLRRRVMP